MRNIRATLLSTSRARRSFANFLKKRQEQCYFIEGQIGLFSFAFFVFFFFGNSL